MIFFKISAFYFFYFAAIGVYIIFLPKVLHDLGYDTFKIGVVFALAPLMRFATPFLFLKYIKLNQTIFKTALILSIICTSCFYLTITNFYAFVVNNAILGSVLSLILPYLEVTAIKSLGKNKYGRSRLYGSIGFALISLVLGRFLSQPFITLHYYLTINILTVVFAFLLLKHDNVEHRQKQSNKPFSLLKHFNLWASMFFMQLSFGPFYNFFTIYETQHQVSLEIISYMWSFGVVCEIVLLYFQAPLLKRNLLNVIRFSLAVTILRWFLLFAYPNNIYITFFTQSIHAFSFGLYHSALIMYLYTLYDNKKLAQQFMYGIAYGLGGFLGALIAGLLYGDYLFLYSALFTFIALIFSFNEKIKNPSV